DKLIWPHHRANFLACRTVRAHRGAQDDAAVPDDLGRDEPDTTDIGVAILLAEPQSLRQVSANDVTVKHGHLAPALQQENGEHLGRSRLTAAAQAGEPDADSLPVARGVCPCAYLGDLWTCGRRGERPTE